MTRKLDIYWPIVESAVDKIGVNWENSAEFWSSFANLSSKEQLLISAHFCDSEICNGGFLQLFSNITGILSGHAQQAFLQFGMPNTAAVFEKALLWFFPEEPLIREKRVEKLTLYRSMIELQIPNAQRSDWDPFLELDELYYNLKEEENGGFLFSINEFSLR
jgi:Domain of unknown function (DUF4375)